ncbi:TetR/AcrR family transcriptional regulator [Caulobacter sp. S45]|uniref:TetR/AcrR family transcriptional regulator n=1 Tax=Caulobacter sp. S45 TaxID=1641861 RepID=UPI00131C7B15|nr:TetR/AcrR family transcriptional regulator [Caulobacter sp. S45]
MRKVDPVKYEERRGGILEAAERCFARHGFHGATIAQICAEAGISPGHLYHYFETKESIIAAIADSELEYAKSRSAQMLESSNLIAALISEIELVNIRHKETGPGVLLDMLAAAGRNAAVGNILRENSASVCELLAEHLRSGQASGQIDAGLDADTAAAVLLSLIDSSKTLSIRVPNLDPKKRSKALEQLITRFLSPPGAHAQTTVGSVIVEGDKTSASAQAVTTQNSA